MDKSPAGVNKTKTQFYGADGFGRDSYIYNSNGGFCPEKGPCQIEALGKYTNRVILKYNGR